MRTSVPGNVVGIRVFGSMARGDNDGQSAADILVVVRDRSGKVPERVVMDYVRPSVNVSPTISWYGRDRLQNMFRSGHLFAWHLSRESRALWGPADIQELFGEPAPYQDALLDISSFQTIIEGIPAALRSCPRNAVYEMGLLYVCVRNIAMSASWHLCDAPDFTRYSPFNFKSRQFCASRADYELAMACRMASQRGLRMFDPGTFDRVLALQEPLILWSEGLQKDVQADAKQRG